MWMPSNQPLRTNRVESATLDWETIGRAIRECVLDAIEMNAAHDLAPRGRGQSIHEFDRASEQE